MGRNNGTFKYKLCQDAQQDPDTGFYSQGGGAGDWLPGCECQIEKQIPAKQKIGADGQMHAYNYDVFIPKHFNGKLELTAQMQILGEDGTSDEFTIQGVDNLNRKYIEVWG